MILSDTDLYKLLLIRIMTVLWSINFFNKKKKMVQIQNIFQYSFKLKKFFSINTVSAK